MNSCDKAIARLTAAKQALNDVLNNNLDSPTVLSRTETSKPTLEELKAEIAAAEADVNASCAGTGPSH